MTREKRKMRISSPDKRSLLRTSCLRARYARPKANTKKWKCNHCRRFGCYFYFVLSVPWYRPFCTALSHRTLAVFLLTLSRSYSRPPHGFTLLPFRTLFHQLRVFSVLLPVQSPLLQLLPRIREAITIKIYINLVLHSISPHTVAARFMIHRNSTSEIRLCWISRSTQPILLKHSKHERNKKARELAIKGPLNLFASSCLLVHRRLLGTKSHTRPPTPAHLFPQFSSDLFLYCAKLLQVSKTETKIKCRQFSYWIRNTPIEKSTCIYLSKRAGQMNRRR